jgi:peptide/nickel transport system substrate-binding protein
MFDPKRRLRLIAVGLTALAALVATACSSSGSSTSASSASSSTLTIGVSRVLVSLDPAKQSSIDGDESVNAAIYSTLTHYDAQQKLVGDLATSWSQTGPTQWTFHIRSGVKFSNGDPLTASTVAWNFERVLAPGTEITNSTLVPIVANVTAPNPATVVFNTKFTYIDLPETLDTFFITEQKWVDTRNATLDPLGSGPYEVVPGSVDLENGVKLVRNPYYYGPKPAYTNVVYKVLASPAARLAALQTHAVDVAIQLEPTDFPELKGDGYTYGSVRSDWNMVFLINASKAPLNNKDVRLALNYGLNKAAIASALLGPSIKPAPGQILVKGYDLVNPSLSAYPYDPQKAKQLLAAAGYPHGITLELSLSSGTYVAEDEIAQAAASELAQAGITLKITQAEYPAWLARTRSANAADLVYIGYSSGSPAPGPRLQIYTSQDSQIHGADPAYDALVAKVFRATTTAQQQAYVDQATQVFYADADTVFLWPQPLTYAVNSNINWIPQPAHWLIPQDFSPKS